MQMHMAWAQKDVTALSQYIDYPALKDSAQLHLAYSYLNGKQVRSLSYRELGEVKASLGPSLHFLDQWVAPETVAALVQPGDATSGQELSSEVTGWIRAWLQDARWVTQRAGLNEMHLFARTNAGPPAPAGLVLSRVSLLRWKVTGVTFQALSG